MARKIAFLEEALRQQKINIETANEFVGGGVCNTA